MSDPGGELFDRWLAHREGRSEGEPAVPEAAGVADPAAPAAATVPRDYAFRPRRGARRALGAALAGSALATIVAGAVAWRERDAGTIAIAVLLLALTAVIWAVRAGSGTARLRIVGGILEIRRDGRTEAFSLVDRYQVIEAVGVPGRPGWRVEFLRRGREPYVVDASMVDPRDFLRVLTHYRPRTR